MVRTQIYITDEEQRKLRTLSRQSGRNRSELIRDAIDDYLARVAAAPKRDALRGCRGMWKDREETAFETIRAEVETRMAT
jgi:metal-responsive CopG/Arc/MetJ family transcriptional regulator